MFSWMCILEQSSVGNISFVPLQITQHGRFYTNKKVVRGARSKWDPIEIQSPTIQVSGNSDLSITEAFVFEVVS